MTAARRIVALCNVWMKTQQMAGGEILGGGVVAFMVQSPRHHPLCASGRLTLWLSKYQMNSGHRDRSFSFNNNWGDAHLRWELPQSDLEGWDDIPQSGLRVYRQKVTRIPRVIPRFTRVLFTKDFISDRAYPCRYAVWIIVHFGFVNFLNRLQMCQMCGPCNPVFWNRRMKQHIFLSLHHQFLLKPEREDTYFYTGPAWGHR